MDASSRTSSVSSVDHTADPAQLTQLTQLSPLPRKRVLAFFNHFVSRTAQALGRFAMDADEKLAANEVRIRRLEQQMTSLETRLKNHPENWRSFLVAKAVNIEDLWLC